MKKIVFIVEGDTELEFINKTLRKYLNNFGIFSIIPYKVTKSRGGLRSYGALKNDIVSSIYKENTIVTTLIDFYRLPFDFPKFEESISILSKSEKVSFLETSLKENIENEKGRNFPNLIPYIQLHEFEALTFASLESFQIAFDHSEINSEKIESIINSYDNIEEINDGDNSHPSQRLKNNIKGYNKVLFGNLIIEETGIEIIMEKAPRFKEWINKLIEASI